MFTAKDHALYRMAKRNALKIEDLAGERVWVDYAKDGIVYFHLMHSMRRYGCKMNAAGMVRRIFPVV